MLNLSNRLQVCRSDELFEMSAQQLYETSLTHAYRSVRCTRDSSATQDGMGIRAHCDVRASLRCSQRIALLNEAWHNCALHASRISQRASFLPSSCPSTGVRERRARSHTYRPQSTQCRRIAETCIDTSMLVHLSRLDKMFILPSS